MFPTMPQRYTSSIVFVGNGQFTAAMFDEREFCNGFGPLEGDQIKAGPVGNFRYSQGRFELLIAPDRIDLRANNQGIAPPALLQAAREVIAKLEPARSAVPITGVGFNCDVVFRSGETKTHGISWCYSMLDIGRLESLAIPARSSFPSIGLTFQEENISYTVRLEPERRSNGENVFVAINGHQVTASTVSLGTCLESFSNFEGRVTLLHHHIENPR